MYFNEVIDQFLGGYMLEKIKSFVKARNNYYEWMDIWCDYKIELDKQLNKIVQSNDIEDLIIVRRLTRMERYCWNKVIQAEKNYKWWIRNK